MRTRWYDLFAMRAAFVLVLVGVAAPVLEAQRAVISTRTIDPGGRDSMLDITVSIDPGDIMRMVGDLLASRQVEERIASSLREAGADRADVAKVRELQSQLATVARRNAGLTSAIRLQCAREEGQPDGYLGVSFVEEIEVRRVGDGAAQYYFGSNPRILSIEPGSPAQRAGLEANDVVVSIAGNDARRPVPLGELLKPGNRLAVRVSRDGRQRDVTVNVAKRPGDYGSPCASLDAMLASSRVPQATFFRRQSGETSARSGSGVVGSGNLLVERGPTGGFIFIAPYAAAGPNLIGGAQFVTLDAQWRETLGVDKGLLVIAVAGGSPAEAAGLRKSDVIIAVGDSTVTSVNGLWRMVDQAGSDPLSLKVQRAKKQVTIVFRATSPR